MIHKRPRHTHGKQVGEQVEACAQHCEETVHRREEQAHEPASHLDMKSCVTQAIHEPLLPGKLGLQERVPRGQGCEEGRQADGARPDQQAHRPGLAAPERALGADCPEAPSPGHQCKHREKPEADQPHVQEQLPLSLLHIS
eukprot:TRINITY_DN47440_c0_g1_i1.p2 TRINITY_DN47440_c0_g1~~TRINITY_DN47440_c0_g1_i1.p2  ORF type:complete len:141 (+),score=10.34 TRINITY_DN47440_c0_g1_i1:82-504(+)